MAFEPSPEDDTTSVFRIEGITDPWTLGEAHVQPTRRESIKCRADFVSTSPLSLALSVLTDEPPVGHIVIGDWGDDGTAGELSKRYNQMSKLAEASQPPIKCPAGRGLPGIINPLP